MGDRTYVIISCQEHKCAELCEILGDEPETTQLYGKNRWVQMGFSECNAALEDERMEAARQGHAFFGWHFAGDDYPAALFASNGDGELYQVLAMNPGGGGGVEPAVLVDLNGNLKDLEGARTALAVYRYVREMAVLEKDKDMDFGERLESKLDCLDNEAVINELDLHDTENVSLLLDYIRVTLSAKTIVCKFCGQKANANTAHAHDGGWVGDECCWDNRLRNTE